MKRHQTPSEIIARDYNWTRGRIIALEQQAQALVHFVAPESDALIRVVAGFTKALLIHLERETDRRRQGNSQAMPRS